jgi:hypothetical protein
MARTTINVYSAQTLPTTYSPSVQIAMTDLSGTTWQSLTLQLTVQNNGSVIMPGHELKLHWAFLQTSITAANALTGIIPDGTVIGCPDLNPNINSGTAIIVSPVINVTADYLYTWLEVCEADANYANVKVSLDAVQTQ